jgi:hypothetical protein
MSNNYVDGRSLLRELLYCLDEGFPAFVTGALLALAQTLVQPGGWRDREARLRSAVEAWEEWGERDNSDFSEAAERMGLEVWECDDCSCITSEATEVSGGMACESCVDEYYSLCYDCESYASNDDIRHAGDNLVCDGCIDRYSYCEECEVYFDRDDDHDHSHDCDCEAPHKLFTFPTPEGGAKQDERFDVELPKGIIDPAGVSAIVNHVSAKVSATMAENGQEYVPDLNWDIKQAVEGVGPEWQTKRGNFTRRLSSALHKLGIKLDADTISAVGNIARDHASNVTTLTVEFTRDLNKPAEYFYHEDSCWWQSSYARSYYESRCALKQWGGIGMRSHHAGSLSWGCSGRAWVQPLNEDLEPTHRADAFAYVVYNGYGDLSGYMPARIVAHLTGKTYKKIDFDADPQYINAGGYLVADEATCEATGVVSVYGDQHDRFDARSLSDSIARSAA